MEAIKLKNWNEEELSRAMNDAWSGKTKPLVVDMGKKITWLCCKGFPKGAIWWKTENGEVFNMSFKTKRWEKIEELSL